MKKTIMILLALSLVCVVAVGSTISYLTYTDAAVNTMAVGHVKISQLEQKRDNGALVDFVDNVKLLPVTSTETEAFTINGADYQMLNTANNAVDKIVTVKNEGTEAVFARTLLAFELMADGKNPLDPEQHLRMVANNVTATGVTFTKGDTQYVVYACYMELAAGATSAPSLLQVYLAPEENGDFYNGVGASYEILALSQAVQVAGFTDGAEAALNESFGAVNEANAAAWFGGIGA